ncbi:MAG: cupin domain-containing protein [Patescibacteria group bacterium]
MHYIQNLEDDTRANTNFRTVVYTDPRFQLVLMSLLPGEDIGEEVHDLDQFIRIEVGNGQAVVDGTTHVLFPGSAVIIPKGARHNIVNTSEAEALKLYSVYAPAQHPAGTVHKTKAEAQIAEAGEHGN